MIDHYRRRKASYYWFKRAAASVKVLVRSRGEALITRVANDTLVPHRVVVRCGWVRVDGTELHMQSHSVSVPANGTAEVARELLPPSGARSPREWIYAAALEADGLPPSQSIWPLAPHRELALATPLISARVVNGVLKVSSPVYCHGVHLEDGGRDILADNYFDLIPGLEQQIRINHATSTSEYPLTAMLPISTKSARVVEGHGNGVERPALTGQN